MERDLKEQIVKSASAVKRKVDLIKDAKNSSNVTLETIFKPIVDPLNILANRNDKKNLQEVKHYDPISKKIKKNESEKSYSSCEEYIDSSSVDDEEYQDTPQKSNKTLTVSPFKDHDVSEGSFKSFQSSPNVINQTQSSSWSTSSEVIDSIPFGIRNERGKLKLGKTRVHDDGRILKVGNISFEKTLGLKELLFKKIPNLDVITEDDLENYKLLLINTNAHRRNFDPAKPINSNKGFKYMSIIKPLFKFSKQPTTSTESLPQGKGIDLLKKLKTNTDFVYWDDPNELIERLKLLLASKAAGNTGLDSEIVAIIEELREAGIINTEYKQIARGKLSSILAVSKASRL